MPLKAADRLGAYEIQGWLGAGGMGEVYRARDLRLNRDVAIKVLSDSIAVDANRLTRFRREAQVLASLNHPNIAQIHGLEEQDERVRPAGSGPFLVMELVEGPTVADRIAKGPIPVDEALPLARQIAEGLEAAHEQGIVHRDLKPANVKVRPDGTVKVLDFGLAKALDPSPGGALPTRSPTITTPAVTSLGVILGTAAYMAPEQARGKAVDRRADIWAFGCVLFEMLAAKPAFGGETVTDVLASVVKEQPHWSDLPRDLPASIATLIRRCLEKDPRRRLQAIGEARLAIETSASEPRSGELPGAARHRERLAWGGVILILTIALGWLAVRGQRASPAIVQTPAEVRFDIPTPGTTNAASFALSPDGQTVVFSAAPDGQPGLWIRSLNATSTRPLPSSAGGTYPFWKTDSRSIGFFADGRLKTLDLGSGSVRELAPAQLGLGGSWNSSDVIIFAPNRGGPLMRVSLAGGPVTPVTKLTPGQVGHRFPEFLPDGVRFLFSVIEPGAAQGVAYAGDLNGSDPRRLVGDGGARYLAPGHLLFGRAGTLYAQPLDVEQLQLKGNPVPVADNISRSNDPGATTWSASSVGAIAFRTETSSGRRQLAWFDRSGAETGALGVPDAATSRNPSLSPNGRFVAMRRITATEADIWLMDARTGYLSKLTSSGGLHNHPVWSPDSTRLAFSANRGRVSDLYLLRNDGTGKEEELLVASDQIKQPEDWSRDGVIVYRVVSPDTSNDLWAVRLTDRTPFPVVQTNFDEREAQFSPDGHWLAFNSNETGDYEIYLQRFPGPSVKKRISSRGGAQMRWRADGKELFYIALDGYLMAVPIALGRDDDPESGEPVRLFQTRVGGAIQGTQGQQYAVDAEGQRFLLDTLSEAAPAITWMLNWSPNR